MEHSGSFCFMDSDILAQGDFLGEMAPYLTECQGVFSAAPIWCTKQEQILPPELPSIPGHCSRTNDGVCLGSSYFAKYEGRTLAQFIESTGIGLGRYQWPAIPAPYQKQLIDMGLKKTRYDTAKLLNILRVAQGALLIFLDCTSLQHIGGVSAQTARRSAWRVRKQLRFFRWPPAARLRRWIWGLSKGLRQPDLAAMTAELRELQVRRRRSALYFHQLFRCLFENLPLPAAPRVGNRGIEERIALATANIVSLYEEYGEQLA
jgi:hypothetical protein